MHFASATPHAKCNHPLASQPLHPPWNYRGKEHRFLETGYPRSAIIVKCLHHVCSINPKFAVGDQPILNLQLWKISHVQQKKNNRNISSCFLCMIKRTFSSNRLSFSHYVVLLSTPWRWHNLQHIIYSIHTL